MSGDSASGVNGGGPTETTPLVERAKPCMSAALKVRILTSIISLAEGYDIGVINGAIVLIKEEIHLEDWQVGISLAIFPFGVALASPVSGSLCDHIGRKPTMLISCIFLIIGGLLMASATSFEHLALGRITAGCGTGIGLTAVTAYMSEVSPAHSRGFFASLEELFVNVGNVLGYMANYFLYGIKYDWRIMLLIGVFPATLCLLTLLLPYAWTGIPESPRWLSKMGRLDEAREVLMELLDHNTAEVDRAVNDWKLEALKSEGMPSWGEALLAFRTSRARMARAGIGAGVINMFTGIQLMMVTTTSLLVATGMSKMQAMEVSMILGTIKALVMLFVALFMLDTWGRRPLLLTSLTVCCGATLMGFLGALHNWGETVVVAGLCLFVTGYSMGVGPVPWVYMPEVFDNRFRSKGCAVGVSTARLCAVTHLFSFPILFPIYGLGGLFGFLLFVNAISMAYVVAFCPETKGLSLESIEQMFIDEPTSDAEAVKEEKKV